MQDRQRFLVHALLPQGEEFGKIQRRKQKYADKRHTEVPRKRAFDEGSREELNRIQDADSSRIASLLYSQHALPRRPAKSLKTLFRAVDEWAKKVRRTSLLFSSRLVFLLFLMSFASLLSSQNAQARVNTHSEQ